MFVVMAATIVTIRAVRRYYKVSAVTHGAFASRSEFYDRRR